MNGGATGYYSGDKLDVFIAFGDGSDTTFQTPIDTNNNSFFAWLNHTYSFAGFFTVKYKVTGPDGACDSLIVQNAVVLGSSCNNITGKAFLVKNNNCTFDSGDDPISGRVVRLKLSGQVVLQTITDNNGDYAFTAAAGNTYIVEMDSMPGANVSCPSAGYHTVSTFPSSNLDFAIVCSSAGFDLKADFIEGFVVPGQKFPVTFKVLNNSCSKKSGVAKVVIDTTKIIYTTSTSSGITVPDSIKGDTLYFGFSQLDIKFMVLGDTTLTLSDSVCMSMIVSPLSGDANTSNNTINICPNVLTSYDPNMKVVLSGGAGPEGYIMGLLLLELRNSQTWRMGRKSKIQPPYFLIIIHRS